MRHFVAGAVLMLVALPAPAASAAKEDYTGRVTFRDGTASTYTWLSVRRDEIPFARDVAEMKDYLRGVLKLQVRAVARIDSDDSPAVRRRITSVLPGYHSEAVRKGTVTFRDGAVYPDVYLDCAGEWGNSRERGGLALPSISSLTISLADFAECPTCKKRFSDPGYKFCPFDGAELNRPGRQAAAAPGPAAAPAGQGTAVGSSVPTRYLLDWPAPPSYQALATQRPSGEGAGGGQPLVIATGSRLLCRGATAPSLVPRRPRSGRAAGRRVG